MQNSLQSTQITLTNLHKQPLPRLEDYVSLLRQCVTLRDMKAVVYVYDKIKEHGFVPNERVFELINRLHSKTIPEACLLSVPCSGKRSLAPRRRIHKIMKGHQYTAKYQAALEHVQTVKQFINSHPEVTRLGRIALAKTIQKKCHISFNNARFVITNLKRTGFLKDLCKPSPPLPTTVSTHVLNSRSTKRSCKNPPQKRLDQFFSISN